jgi:septum formation protein
VTDRLVLGSGSPRRSELLGHLGVAFEVRPADIDESELPGEDPVTYVVRLAREKAEALTLAADEVAIAADTTVDVDGQILAKPEDSDDARRMLRLLSDRTHEVHTGVAVRRGSDIRIGHSTSQVTMVELSEAMIDWYIALGEPFGKAGAYAIQGAGGAFVERIEGSVSGIIGLPMTLLVKLARDIGITLVGD